MCPILMSPACRSPVLPLPGPARPAPVRQAGFSLIEVVVSLAILALAGTIIVPGAVEMVERFDSQAKLSLLVDQIENSRGMAVTRGEIIVLASSDTGPPTGLSDIPDGWQVTFPTPMVFSPAAVCSGQGVVIVTPSRQRRYFALDPATCRLERS